MLEYAQKQIELTAKENSIQNVIILNGNLHIELFSGKCYELSDREIKYQAEEFLKSELEGIKNA